VEKTINAKQRETDQAKCERYISILTEESELLHEHESGAGSDSVKKFSSLSKRKTELKPAIERFQADSTKKRQLQTYLGFIQTMEEENEKMYQK